MKTIRMSRLMQPIWLIRPQLAKIPSYSRSMIAWIKTTKRKNCSHWRHFHKLLKAPNTKELSHTLCRMVALVSDTAQTKDLSMVVVPVATTTVKAARVEAVCAVIVRSNVVIKKPMRVTNESALSIYPIYMMRMIALSLILFAGVMTKTLTP